MIVGPIFVREAMTAPRRFRHYLARTTYSGGMLVLMWTAWQVLVGFQRVESAGDVARFGSVLFRLLSVVQLALAMFFAPIVACSSISSEKDRRTLDLLLMTDLTNWEIVMGKLLGSLLQMGVLLACSVPVFSVCLLLGGASPEQVARVFAVTAAAALASGSLGILMAAARDKTFQALALTVLIIAIYLVGVAIAMLRVWNPSRGGPTYLREAAEELERRLAAEPKEPERSRSIWDNPVLWREMCTRAYGRRPLVIKVAYVLVFAMIAAGFYLAASGSSQVGRLDVAKALVPIVITSLILINVQAVTSITSERDVRALDLLLVTDLTPKEFIFGKILGVLYNTKEMVVLPIGLCACLLVRGDVGLESCVYLVGGVLVLITFATALGLHAALAYEKTRLAVVNSLGTIVFLFIGIMICIFLILISSRFESQAASFVVFLCGGAVGLYASLAVRNQSMALALVSFLCPWGTWWAIVHFLQGGDPGGSFLVSALSYSFAVLAMLVPAVSEFDVALGRTVADEG